jgi:hypothetical protein
VRPRQAAQLVGMKYAREAGGRRITYLGTTAAKSPPVIESPAGAKQGVAAGRASAADQNAAKPNTGESENKRCMRLFFATASVD